jgi:citronellol/citronellal dehydrogenase
MNLDGKTAFISGGSRGIGRSIALKLASLGCQIVVTGKSVEEDPRLGGTIYSVAAEIEQAGSKALAIPCDNRQEEQIQAAIQQAVEHFGGIDILINNASAIRLNNTQDTPAKAFDLMHQINVRGTYLVVHHALPWLKKSTHAHILTLSPPINLDPKWLGPHVAYTLSKYSMSVLAMGWAEEFKSVPIASNTLWPKTTIATAAVKNLLGGEQLMKMSRWPEIVADATAAIVSKAPDLLTGKALIDEDILKGEGTSDFTHYAVTPGGSLYPDLFL